MLVRDAIDQALVVVGALVNIIALLAVVLLSACADTASSPRGQQGPVPCGTEQAVTVNLFHASLCAAAQGWIAFDRDAVTFHEFVPAQNGCLVQTHYEPGMGTRWDVLRWSLLCGEESARDTLPLGALRITATAMTTGTMYVERAATADAAWCGALADSIRIDCVS